MGVRHALGRREFLARIADAGGVAAVSLVASRVAAGSGPAADPVPWKRGGRVMLDKVTREAFAEHLGKTFRIDVDGGEPVTVELIEATALGHGSPGRREPFSLVFRGPATPHLPQQTYAMSHEGMGRLDVFLVPIGPDETGVRYEAVFN